MANIYTVLNFRPFLKGDFDLGNPQNLPLEHTFFFSVKLKKPPVSLGKSGFVPETTKPRALGACGLYLLF
jgi:hypothetical protein